MDRPGKAPGVGPCGQNARNIARRAPEDFCSASLRTYWRNCTFRQTAAKNETDEPFRGKSISFFCQAVLQQPLISSFRSGRASLWLPSAWPSGAASHSPASSSTPMAASNTPSSLITGGRPRNTICVHRVTAPKRESRQQDGAEHPQRRGDTQGACGKGQHPLSPAICPTGSGADGGYPPNQAARQPAHLLCTAARKRKHREYAGLAQCVLILIAMRFW